jgi:hypothetical protein
LCELGNIHDCIAVVEDCLDHMYVPTCRCSLGLCIQ